MLFKPLSLYFSKKSTSVQGFKYTTCFDLPLYNFIKITLTDDLNYLVISGNPGQLAETWADILGEYSDMCGTPKMQQAFKIRKQIVYLSNKIYIVNMVLNHLSLSHSKNALSLLAGMGYAFKSSDINADIDRTRKTLNNDSSKLKVLKADYALLTKDEGEQATEEGWDDELFELGKFQGFPINKKTMTVSEYLAVKRKFNSYVEYLKKNNRV